VRHMLAYLAHHELGSELIIIIIVIIIVSPAYVGLPERYQVLSVGLHAHG